MRPIGISILSIFLLVIGALMFIAGIMLVVFSAVINAIPGVSQQIATNLSQLQGVLSNISSLVATQLIVVSIGGFIIIMGIIMALIGWVYGWVATGQDGLRSYCSD